MHVHPLFSRPDNGLNMPRGELQVIQLLQFDTFLHFFTVKKGKSCEDGSNTEVFETCSGRPTLKYDEGSWSLSSAVQNVVPTVERVINNVLCSGEFDAKPVFVCKGHLPFLSKTPATGMGSIQS